MTVIVVTGTPGTGKTELAKALAAKLNYDYFDVKMFIANKKLYAGYDKKRDTYIVDEKRLVKAMLKAIKGRNIVVDSHLAHELPAKYVDLCIVTKCEIKILRERLKERGYTEEKIKENVDAEIFDICLNEAYEAGHKLLVIDTSKRTISEILSSLPDVMPSITKK